MNSRRPAWTPFLAGPTHPHRQAKGDTEARYSEPCVEIYSLAGLVQNTGQVRLWEDVT